MGKRLDGKPIMTEPRRKVIDWLNSIGGELLPNGRGYLTREEITDGAGLVASSTSVATFLGGMERDGILERTVNGKRTKRIALTAAYRDVTSPAPSQPEQGEPEEVTAGSENPLSPPAVAPPVDPAVEATAIAIALLDQLTSRLDEIDGAKIARERMAGVHRQIQDLMAEKRRLEVKLSTANDEIHAKNDIIRRLQGDKRYLQAQCDQLREGRGAVPQELVERASRTVERIMGETPRAHHPDDYVGADRSR